jgi:hypothetical protein
VTVARRPAARTVRVEIPDGDYAGWSATVLADFPAGLLAKLQSPSVESILEVLDTIIVEHNFPNSRDELAASMAEVDPYGGLMTIAGRIFDELGKLPNR